MNRDLSQNGQEQKTLQLLEYEQKQDNLLLNNTPFTTRRTHIGFGTEKKDHLDSLKTYNDNIVFTNRKNIDDMNVVPNIMKILQVSGDIDE